MAHKNSKSKISKADERVTVQNDGTVFEYNMPNGRLLKFRLPNENFNKINIDDPRVYSADVDELMEAAKKVRSQPLFGDVDLDRLAESYPFRPFDYQKENVRAMIDRFGAKGVFGEQVGLGKTVEALMTAHVMFESGAIRNALIIVPHKLIDSWKREIESKFPGIFKVTLIDKIPSEKRFIETIRTMREDNENEDGSYRLYLVTDLMIKRHADDIANYTTRMTNRHDMLASLDPERRAKIEAICGELESLSPRDRVFDPDEVLREAGWDSFRNEDFGVNRGPFRHNSIEACEMIKSSLMRLKKKISIFRTSDNGPMELVEELIRHFDSTVNKLCDEANEADLLEGLVKWGDNQRLVDLLIVDEVHTFYERETEDRKERTDFESRDKAVGFIAEINKSFCILISATPVRERLEDIFDLLYIADKTRFGKNAEKSKEYFYKTVCQIDEGAEHKLCDMIFDEKAFREAAFGKGDLKFNEVRASNFFGVINNSFTRRRINDVSEDMKGTADLKYAELKPEEKAIIDILHDRIIERRELMYIQSVKPSPEVLRGLADDSYESWKIYGTAEREGVRGEDERKGRLHMRAAIDAVLIEAFGNPSIITSHPEYILWRSTYEKNGKNRLKHVLHSMIDWRRRGKTGIALVLDSDGSKDRSEMIIKAATEVSRLIEGANDTLKTRNVDRAVLDRLASKMVAPSDVSLDGNGPEDYSGYANKIHKINNSIIDSLKFDASVLYVYRTSTKNVRNVRSRIADILREGDGVEGRSVVIADRGGIDLSVDRNNYNRAVIVNQGYQAGFNLQSYRNFVFSQLNQGNDDLLEPVDIEQWVGRIHRTGQIKNCKIVTVLATFMNHPSNDPSPEFLKEYYGILSDAAGLDLYGDTTPDVAFIQPIVVDCMRKYLCFMLEDGRFAPSLRAAWREARLPSNNAGTELTRGWINGLGFSEIMELCHNFDERNGNKHNVSMIGFALVLIEKLCMHAGFGKPGVSNRTI